MSKIHAGPEHEFEAQYGLPEALPGNEKVLWQGSPQWWSLAVGAFHLRKLAIYFALLLALRMSFAIADGASGGTALLSAGILLPLALFALGLLTLIAWLSARTAVYTITNKRVVMRIGVVLSVTFNLPFARIESAALKCLPDGSGDIPLALARSDRIAYLHMWPHARPWRLAKPEPMLRSVPDAAHVAELLSKAMAEATGGVAALSNVQSSNPGRPRANTGSGLATVS